jgi:hypothetical protein
MTIEKYLSEWPLADAVGALLPKKAGLEGIFKNNGGIPCGLSQNRELL